MLGFTQTHKYTLTHHAQVHKSPQIHTKTTQTQITVTTHKHTQRQCVFYWPLKDILISEYLNETHSRRRVTDTDTDSGFGVTLTATTPRSYVTGQVPPH